MEEAKCMMWVKSKHMITRDNHLTTTKPMNKFNHDAYISWKDNNHHHEDAAFVDIATRGTHIDGVWPPRSYTCSFCKREFKSAQALGGHMNVHRRDRALLKQVIINNPNNNNINKNNNRNNISPFIASSPPLKSHDHYSKNPLKSSHLSSSRKNFIVSSKFSQNSHKYHVSAKKIGEHVKVKNFQGERNDEYLSYKRCKKNGAYVALLPLFHEEIIKHSNAKSNGILQVPENLASKATKSMDDLDLELRLGNI